MLKICEKCGRLMRVINPHCLRCAEDAAAARRAELFQSEQARKTWEALGNDPITFKGPEGKSEKWQEERKILHELGKL